MYTSIQRWGNSNAIRIPKPIMESAKMQENERVEISVDEEGIHVKSLKRKYKNLAERFEGYEGTYDVGEIDVGRMGREVW